MKVLVKKWGTRPCASRLLEAAQLKLDQPVDVREDQGRIVIEPKRARAFALADLVRT